MKKRKEEEKTRENLGLFVTKNPICLPSRGKCALEAITAAVVTGGEVGAEV